MLSGHRSRTSADTLDPKMLGQLNPRNQSQGMHRGSIDDIRSPMFLGILLGSLFHITVEIYHIQHTLLAVALIGAGSDKDKGCPNFLRQVLLPQAIIWEAKLCLAMPGIGSKKPPAQ